MFAVGVTIYRARRREYRELWLWCALVVVVLAGIKGIYLLPEGWKGVGFWTVCAALVTWLLVSRRASRAAST